MTAILNLVVLRSANIESAVGFYSRLGLQFIKHRHGTRPEHNSAELAGTVFELYPQHADGLSTVGTRIGFTVPSVDEIIKAHTDYPQAILSPPKESEWGRRAIVADPDGHRIELVQSSSTY